MKVEKIFEMHKMLRKELGKDLVYSLVHDNGKTLMCISTHKSTKSFVSGRDVQTCEINKEDFNKDLKLVVKEISDLYKGVLLEEGEENPLDIVGLDLVKDEMSNASK